ncbi:uncharacterized protein BO80DRAFT_421548 [Aspergillus ibericus CBS 121593]|uniref:Uncharacterized protein n=1 Tax=Aspergillus ibericus CBS 121593 TaxID=1448316 RepID=A0A395HDH8_9EURO|nr:hypothetical protein BO80DRAFT_421548 [Aspergillus ibericus CBS 121593]RAL05523.1 hypothetical protein BO80DRAFT_421548 [Aspergillus ibericus CBS 121593]
MSQTACPVGDGRSEAPDMPSMETDTIIVGMSPSACYRRGWIFHFPWSVLSC